MKRVGSRWRGSTVRAFVLVWAVAGMAACDPDVPPPAVAPGDPLPGLSDAERGRFLLGRALFERITTPEEGLGPLYNAERCSACHEQPAVGGGGRQVPVLKATRFADGTCDLLTESGGDNIQLRGTALLVEHGLGPEEVPPEATDTVRVVAPPLFGLGLLEAVPDSVLVALADPDDRDGDGVSGRLPRRADGRAARFGRKGEAADVAGFVDTALRFELGLTTPEHPVEEARNGRPVPPAVDPAPDPEIDARGVALLGDYIRLLAPPAPERAAGAAADSIARGRAVFRDLGCARCHVPELQTGSAEVDALDRRPVRAYSDLLVHDLGEPIADVCGPDVGRSELRTAPLWGLRHRDRYLHDGSAADPAAAIARHGGEAGAAREAFIAATPDTRALLLRFLDSL